MRIFFMVLLLFGLGTSNASAQFSLGQQEATVQTNPEFPEPFETVTASLDAYSYDTQGATIRWFIDGLEVTDALNERTVTFSVGALGTPVVVSAQVTLKDGARLTPSKTITPTRVDVVIEADTLVPAHYKGRALPSSGSTIRAIAVPMTTTSVQNLSFTWSVDGKVLNGGPLLGKDITTFSLPQGGTSLLTVEVSEKTGRVLARKTTEVRAVEPEIHFYEDNPLRGLSRTAIVSPHLLIGDEMVVRAEPYYMASNIFATAPHIEWKINGSTVENPSDDPQKITLRSSGGGTGTFTVDFHVRNLSNLLQGAREQFSVRF